MRHISSRPTQELRMELERRFSADCPTTGKSEGDPVGRLSPDAIVAAGRPKPMKPFAFDIETRLVRGNT
jgi:hypothetical protein